MFSNIYCTIAKVQREKNKIKNIGVSIVIYTDRNITRKLALQRMNITGRGLADSGRKCGIGFNRPKSNSFTAKSEFDKSNRVQTVGVPFICPKDVIHKLFFSVGIPTTGP